MGTAPMKQQAAVELFFKSHERASAAGDMPALSARFADTFLAAGPNGAQAVKGADFALALPKRKKLFESLGCRETKLVSLRQTALDDRYVLAATRWSMNFVREEGNEPILVDSTFIVDTAADPFRIILYLAHQDIMSILKQRGIAAA